MFLADGTYIYFLTSKLTEVPKLLPEAVTMISDRPAIWMLSLENLYIRHTRFFWCSEGMTGRYEISLAWGTMLQF